MNAPKIQQETIFDIFNNFLEVDEEIFTLIIDMFREENISDALKYLQIEVNQISIIKNSSNADEGYKLDSLGRDIKIILNTLKNIKDNEFNLKDIST